MRLLLSLISYQNQNYDFSYYTKIQGFIYKCLKETEYSFIHDLKHYKFFCFSNIFPVENFEEGKKYYLQISTPDANLINILNLKIQEIINHKKLVQFGELKFFIESSQIINPVIKNRVMLISATPIIIRISNKQIHDSEFIFSLDKSYSYYYWKANFPMELFIKNLRNNLIKKYIFFHKLNDSQEIRKDFLSLNFNATLKKEVAVPLIIKEKRIIVIGTIWKFDFYNLSEKQKELLKFSIDSGFGEKNSFGFGFLNILKRKKI
ncbi:MAG: CRISPR-associated endoribonuclease Cas6 [Candidatus Woesearchaeota archaeon]